MSLFFQHPALLGLLALAALPLLVHLLSRAKPPSYRFSNTEFLRRILRLTSRYRKPKDWLLLLLRTLAILAIATAFLGPLLLSNDAALPGERRTIVCLIDRSASMAAKEGATSRFEAAGAAAAKLLESARPELANIVWIDATPDATFPDPGPNREFLVEELSRAAVRSEPNAIATAFELANRQFPNAEGRRELHVFSDFQQSSWKDIAPIIPSDIDLRLIPVAGEDVANLSLSSLVPIPASPVAGRPLLVQCRVTNHSSEARRVSLTLDAGGSRQSQPLDLPPGGITEASFSVRLSASGLMPLSAGIDSDAFPLDDQRHAVVRVRESLRMAIAAAHSDPVCATLSKVADALPWLDAIPDADAAEAARLKATKAHQEAAELLDRLANDFPAFEVEKRLKQLAAESASNAKQNLAALEKFDPEASEGNQRRAIREMLDRLGRNQPEMDQLQIDAETLAEAGKVLEMAAKFQQIYSNQASVTERIKIIAKEIGKGIDQNRRLLPSLAETQKKNREALDRFAEDLRKRAEAIKSPALAPMRDSALEFLQALAMADPNSVMDLASESARLGEANDAFVSAELARALLENLLNQPNSFSSMCQGQCMVFGIPRPDVNRTMAQMLAGLMSQNPGTSPNQGQGAGGFGMGGTGPTGNAQPGFANLDIPVVGPQRMQFEPASMNGEAGGESGSMRDRVLNQASENETLNPSDPKHATDAAPDLEDIPAVYREAVKDYFTPDKSTTSP